MEHRDKRIRGIAQWLYAAVLVVAIVAAAGFWFRGHFEKHWNVPHAMYATGQLVNVYHAHKQKNGRWPEPGQYVAKEVTFVRSYDDKGVRVDVFDFGGGQYALLRLHEHALEVLPTRDQRPGGAAP